MTQTVATTVSAQDMFACLDVCACHREQVYRIGWLLGRIRRGMNSEMAESSKMRTLLRHQTYTYDIYILTRCEGKIRNKHFHTRLNPLAPATLRWEPLS